MLDLLLAVLHHLLIFAVFGVVVAELALLKPGAGPATVRRLSAIDAVYGLAAVAVIVVGFCRAIFAAKGWAYYSHNGFFWAKIATFAVIGALSASPTIAFIRARRTGTGLADAQVARLRRFLQAEAGLFPLLLVFAAAMARGYGGF